MQSISDTVNVLFLVSLYCIYYSESEHFVYCATTFFLGILKNEIVLALSVFYPEVRGIGCLYSQFLTCNKNKSFHAKKNITTTKIRKLIFWHSLQLSKSKNIVNGARANNGTLKGCNDGCQKKKLKLSNDIVYAFQVRHEHFYATT